MSTATQSHVTGETESAWLGVDVDCDLDRARLEWLHTNGAGAYASSTIAEMHTRRYHGLLVAAVEPPRKRQVILSHMDARIDIGDERHDLGTHQFPHVVPTGGYRYLVRFDQDPLPRWTFKVGAGTFEQTIALARGQNALVLRYVWRGPGPVGLTVRPLLALRTFHQLVHEHGLMVQSVELRQGEVRVRPVPSMPRVVFGHKATFIGSPDWWRRFEYLVEQTRGLEFQEDLWTPGIFSIPLTPNVPAYILASVDPLPTRPPEELLAETAAVLERDDPGPGYGTLVRRLSVAAGAFRADQAPEPGIIAGYPWFEVLGRHSLIALPGLYLVQNDLDGARAVLKTLLSRVADGLVPNRLPDDGQPPEYHAADTTLWLFEAARLYAERAGMADTFLCGPLFDALAAAFEALLAGTRHNMHVASSGLFAASDPGFALTWMDAKIGDWVVTPRAGLPVELQALWARACSTLEALATQIGAHDLAGRARDAYGRAVAAFRQRFWCEATGYPYDVVSETTDGGAWEDATIRPNGLIALAVEPSLFGEAQARSIVSVAERDLLTPAGLRSLAPHSPGYCGRYAGSARDRDAAYHEGTVWPYLVGFYVRAARRVGPDTEELRNRLEGLVRSAASNALALGQVPEVADAEPPHRPGGCIAQAWSVAELLRALSWDLA